MNNNLNLNNEKSQRNPRNPRNTGLLSNLYNLLTYQKDPEKWFTLAFENQARKYYRDAQICYTKVLSLDPKCANAWNNYGNMFYNKALNKIALAEDATAECHGAIDCFNKALEIEPQNGGFWNNLRIVYYYGLRDFSTAEDCYRKIKISSSIEEINHLNMNYKMRSLKISPNYKEKKKEKSKKKTLLFQKAKEKVTTRNLKTQEKIEASEFSESTKNYGGLKPLDIESELDNIFSKSSEKNLKSSNIPKKKSKEKKSSIESLDDFLNS
ncbi:MAG: hypothetical protein ACTSWY_01435 [Promethearchaeota archaeon]